jgi:hypothetical protein
MQHAKVIYTKMRKNKGKAPDMLDNVKLGGNAIRRLIKD